MPTSEKLSQAQISQSVGVADTWAYYATVSSDIDATLANPKHVAGYSTPKPPRAFMVLTAGNLVVTRWPGGSDYTLAVAANVVYPLPVSAVKTAGTTAAGLILMW